MDEFRDIYERHYAAVYRLALFLTGDANHAEDLTADTFVRAWTARDRLRVQTVRAYLLTIGGTSTGISIGGIGVGAAGEVKGVSIGGIGVGSGKAVTGLSIGGIGVGAPALNGLVISAIAAGAQDVHAIVIAGAFFKVEPRGRFDGGSLSLVNNVRGEQHGLTIGLFNYARELHGAQVGLINISDNSGSRRVLPLISVR